MPDKQWKAWRSFGTPLVPASKVSSFPELPSLLPLNYDFEKIKYFWTILGICSMWAKQGKL
jgi:hypothetical protein